MTSRIELVIIALIILCVGALAAEESEYSTLFKKAQGLAYNGSLREANLTYENVLILCDENLARNSDDAQAWHDRGLALFYMELMDAADESFNKSIDILNRTIEGNPEGAADAWLLMAQNYEALSMPEAAIRAYDKVTETNSSNALGAWIRKSDLLVPVGAYNESVEAFDKAAELMPGKPLRMNVIWKEENTTFRLDCWEGKDGVYRVSIGRYNTSNQKYDSFVNIMDEKSYAICPMAKGIYPFDIGGRSGLQWVRGGTRSCCYCSSLSICNVGWCSNIECPYQKSGCCANMQSSSCCD
jgi:tetratricopeptide (TPR) repeat protein